MQEVALNVEQKMESCIEQMRTTMQELCNELHFNDSQVMQVIAFSVALTGSLMKLRLGFLRACVKLTSHMEAPLQAARLDQARICLEFEPHPC